MYLLCTVIDFYEEKTFVQCDNQNKVVYYFLFIIVIITIFLNYSKYQGFFTDAFDLNCRARYRSVVEHPLMI